MNIRYGTLPVTAGVAVFDQRGVLYGQVPWNQVAAHYDARDNLRRVENAQSVSFPMAASAWSAPFTHMKVYLPFGGVELTCCTLATAVTLLPGASLCFPPGCIVMDGAAALALLGGYTKNYPRDGERFIDVPAPRLVLP